MHRPKPWARHLEADRQRQERQAQQQDAFLQRARRWFWWMRAGVVLLAVIHWAILATAFRTVWWHPLVAVAMAGVLSLVLPRCPMPLLTGGGLGGLQGLVMALLTFGPVVEGPGGFGQVMILVFVGFGMPVMAGMGLGYLVSRWDEDHLHQ
jgi:hypothetical protein